MPQIYDFIIIIKIFLHFVFFFLPEWKIFVSLRGLQNCCSISNNCGAVNYIPSQLGRHGFLEHILFPLIPNSSLFIFKSYPFDKQIQRFNKDSPKCYPLFTTKNPSPREIEQILKDYLWKL